jgi:hypothetical protein
MNVEGYGKKSTTTYFEDCSYIYVERDTSFTFACGRGIHSCWVEISKSEVLKNCGTVIPGLTSDPANDFFRLTKIFFRYFSDSANNVLVDARANIKQQTLTVGPFQELIFSVWMCVTKK